MHRLISPDKTLEIILQSIAELVDYELAVVLGYDGKGRLDVRKAMGPLSGTGLETYSIALDSRPDIAKIMDSGRPRLFERGEDHIDTYAGVLDLPSDHSCLAAPIVADGTTIGLLTLDHRSCGVFSREILRFIEVISRLIALSLNQTDTSQELKATNELLLTERNSLLDTSAAAFRGLAGSSRAWLSAIDAIKLVAATDSPVLILGETGTGKEEAAKAIHALSSRAAAPFVALNCSALPAALAESELFGHERGSFTDAHNARRGRFELADGGTLFLDEIGDLPPEVQPKLLRALQEGRFERLGGEVSLKTNVRILAATHVDLSAAVASAKFREDLLYRLAVFPITMPPLRERHGDIAQLAEFFAERLRRRSGWEALSFDKSALDMLEAYDWPGNIRELGNTVERAAILARGRDIHARHVRLMPLGGKPTEDVPSLASAEKNCILAALEKSAGKIYGAGGAAELLGLKPSTLQSRMKKLRIAVRTTIVR